MYIFKNALRSIVRSKGRNILVGIIVLVIAVSTCVALSIREAASKAKLNMLNSIEVTAQISPDRQSLIKKASSSDGTAQPDRNAMKEAFSGTNELSLDEMKKYAGAGSVKDFYYTMTASLNSSGIEPIDTTATSSSSSSSSSEVSDSSKNTGAGKGQMYQENAGTMGKQGSFSVIGYSSDNAMSSFAKGTSTITDGSMFDEGSLENVCVISDELATYNSLKVGDSITLENPNNTNETAEFKITGIYHNSESTVSTTGRMGGFSASLEPANQILTTYNALNAIVSTSSTNATSTTNSNGQTSTNAIRSQLSGTYIFSNVDNYNNFVSDVRDMGLSDTYAVTSSDVASYEQGLQPLENLSSFATYFLIVVLLIGGVILIVLNIFNIRERKYEIGVLTAIGMKKHKVSLQFISELFVVTFSCILIGAAVGASVSLPITNSLLASQVTSQQEKTDSQMSNFGRKNSLSANQSAPNENSSSGKRTQKESSQSARNEFAPFASVTTNYISKVSSATNLVVIAQLIGIGILLTIISSMAGVVFVLRYGPLKILTNRD